MADTSNNLSLPFLLASQARKHVTFNELVNKIDALLMLSVVTKSQSGPPISPIEGQRYIVAENAIDEWHNKSGLIAIYQNLGWDYIKPQKGFIVYIEDENNYYIYNGAWVSLYDTLGQTNNFSKIGIGTNADNLNPLSIKLNSALCSAKYAAEDGDGNLRLNLNKENTARTASFIFKNNWSGRAEFGLLGDDNFTIKTSVDGVNWKTVFSVNSSTGIAKFTDAIDFPAASQNSQNIIMSIGGRDLIKTPYANNSDGYNTCFGINTFGSNISAPNASYEASYNCAFGYGSLYGLTTGYLNVSIGLNALGATTIGNGNTVIGSNAMRNNINGSNNAAIGHDALWNNISGSGNAAIGAEALLYNGTGAYNTAIGQSSLKYKVDGNINNSFNYCSGLGYDSRVSASNQIQLGGFGTNTYAYGAVQDRSDVRDKTDVRDTVLGLEFVKSLRPVDFIWDMRDCYFDMDIERAKNGIEQTKLVTVTKDGSRKRKRYHHGLIAQEVKATIDAMGIDFGGYQDHAVNGGCDVLTIGYTELIAPLIKAIQELELKIHNLENNVLST